MAVEAGSGQVCIDQQKAGRIRLRRFLLCGEKSERAGKGLALCVGVTQTHREISTRRVRADGEE